LPTNLSQVSVATVWLDITVYKMTLSLVQINVSLVSLVVSQAMLVPHVLHVVLVDMPTSLIPQRAHPVSLGTSVPAMKAVTLALTRVRYVFLVPTVEQLLDNVLLVTLDDTLILPLLPIVVLVLLVTSVFVISNHLGVHKHVEIVILDHTQPTSVRPALCVNQAVMPMILLLLLVLFVQLDSTARAIHYRPLDLHNV